MTTPAHTDPTISPRALMLARGLSVVDITRLSGVSETYVRQLVRGKERRIALTLAGASLRAVDAAVPLRDRAPVRTAYRLGRALGLEPDANPFLYSLPTRAMEGQGVPPLRLSVAQAPVRRNRAGAKD